MLPLTASTSTRSASAFQGSFNFLGNGVMTFLRARISQWECPRETPPQNDLHPENEFFSVKLLSGPEIDGITESIVPRHGRWALNQQAPRTFAGRPSFIAGPDSRRLH
jgi:hypothetical protein